MRKAIVLGIVALALAGIVGAVAFGEPPNVEEVMKAHVAAVGGKDAIENAKSIHRSGVATMGGVFGDMEGTFEEKSVLGKKAYTYIDMGVFNEKQGWNGEIGWKVNSMEGASDLQGPELDTIKTQLVLHPLASTWLDAGPDAINVLEDESLGGENYHVFQLAEAENIKFFIDPESHLLSGVRIPVTDPTFGDTTILVRFDDYERYDGIMLPDTQHADIADGTIVIDYKYKETAINPELEDTIFEKP